MAAPRLNTGGTPTSPRRTLLNSGTVPTKKLQLLGSGGKVIHPKQQSPAQQEPAASEAQAAYDAQAAAEAEAEYQRQLAEYNRQMAEYEAALEAQRQAEAAAEEARKAAEAEAARQAAEAEAARQAAAQEAAAHQAVAASPAATPKPAALKPAGAKPAALKPAGAKPAALKPAGAKPAALKPAGAKPAAPKSAPLPQTRRVVPTHVQPSNVGSSSVPAPASVPGIPQEIAQESPEATPIPAQEIDPNGVDPQVLNGEIIPEITDQPESAQPAEPTEEELRARDIMLTRLREQADAIPLHKKPIFYVVLGLLIVFAVGCTVYVMKENAKQERIAAKREYYRKLMHKSQDINQKGVNTLAGAQEKKVDVTCSLADAKALLEILVDPYIKTESGSNLLGNEPIGVARNASVLLAIAAEADPKIDELIFDTLGKQCAKMPPELFDWQLQCMAVSANKDLNSKLRTLFNKVNARKDWKNKPRLLGYIWQAMGLRVNENDVDDIVKLLADDKIDNNLVRSLTNALDNILLKIEDPAHAAEVADGIFEKLPEKYRHNMMVPIARSCSTKAREYYKKRMEDPANWKKELIFFGYWGNDDILDYVAELREKAKGDPKKESLINQLVSTIFSQNRDRSVADAEKLLHACYENPFPDTSDAMKYIEKTEGINAAPEGSAEYKEAMEKLKAIEVDRKLKERIIRSLAGMTDHPWVIALLNKYKADKDSKISSAADRAIEQTKKNKENEEALKAKISTKYSE